MWKKKLSPFYLFPLTSIQILLFSYSTKKDVNTIFNIISDTKYEFLL